jgi:polyisoprenyl-phosphate glycosyltransferase
MKKSICVVVPCYNEEAVIEQTHARLLSLGKGSGYVWKILYVNDGSADRTTELLDAFCTESDNVGAIHLARNFGHQAAVCAGLLHAKGDYAAIIDADLQDPPEAIEKMVGSLIDHGVDIVYGQREKRKSESFFKKSTSAVFYRLLNALSDVKFPVDVGDFRVISRKALDCFNSLPEGAKYIRGLMSWMGLPSEPYSYVREARAAGETKYTLKKMIKLASDGILSFSTKPLRLMTSLGLFCVLIGLALGLWALVQKIVGMKVAVGWTSLIIAIVFLGGVQLLSLGMMGAYIGRIFEEVKKRPDYIIRRFSDSMASDHAEGVNSPKAKKPVRSVQARKVR